MSQQPSGSDAPFGHDRDQMVHVVAEQLSHGCKHGPTNGALGSKVQKLAGEECTGNSKRFSKRVVKRK